MYFGGDQFFYNQTKRYNGHESNNALCSDFYKDSLVLKMYLNEGFAESRATAIGPIIPTAYLSAISVLSTAT